jgi:hypothetical protein
MKYIVDFHNDAPDAEITQYLSDNGCTVLKEWDNFDKVFLVEAATEPPVTSIVAFVKDDTNTLAIKPMDVEINKYHGKTNPNYPLITISTTDEKDWWKNYTLQNPVFDEPTATYSQKGSNIHVYIMDSGIKADHPEFQGLDISYLYSITPGDFSDNKGHGTALASVIAGKTCGISSAKLKIVKMFDSNQPTYQSQFLDALDAIMADVPPNSFAILNCSWSIPRNEWVEYKLKECMDDGVWVFAAAGNSGTAISNVTPAAMPEAFTVGSYNKDLKPSDFSDYTGNSAISYTSGHTNIGDLNGWAPGEDIHVATLDGSYSYVAGTSISCAIACAVAAHNLSDSVDSNGHRLPGHEGIIAAGADASAWLIVGRPDILDLSDPKYANTTNLIVTMIEQRDFNQSSDEVMGTVRAGQEATLFRFFSPHQTKSFELLDPLPENFYLLPYGAVFGRPSIAQGPTGPDPYTLITIRGKRISNDDVEEIITGKIYILESNFQPSQLPEDHEINYQLLYSCSNFPVASCGLYYSPACIFACGGGGDCCEPAGKPSSLCICVDPFSTQ